jgi:hypothetical protein
MRQFYSMSQKLTETPASAEIWQSRLPRLRNRPNDVAQQQATSCRCIVDHLPPDMSEEEFRELIEIAPDVPITWFPGSDYIWCLVSVTEAEALVMEQRLDGLVLDDEHTLRCEAIGSGGSTYASSWFYQMPVA